MKKILTIAACISISCSGLVNAGDTTQRCQRITADNFASFMVPEKNRQILNPFGQDQCVPISYQEKDTGSLTMADFNDNPDMMAIYEEFLETDKMHVDMVYDRGSQKLHTFFKFNIEDESDKRVEWRKQRKLIAHFEEFLFLHELLHLDADVTRGNYSRNEKEAISDIGAVLLITSKHDLSTSNALRIMKDLYKARKNEAKEDFAGPGRNGKENKDHFDKKVFKNAIAFLEKLEDNDITIKVKSLHEARDIAKAIVTNNEAELDSQMGFS